MTILVRKLIDTLQEVEDEIRENERRLQMRLDCADSLQEKIINLLKRDDLTNDEKISTLKNFFMI